ncbi:hypothetical protein LTR56_012249 [Elasticomyces elasticus]|nr:hypothetical protein LTR56_012249 [Elasticomyces elasticus]KAK3653050.1 hypothetical protein LTR22_011438 [Elasticomyces elasticus]KAK4919553.1 hypothetical protein LTR49_012773 [Elasticomyces elasticus]KAK5763093.1 hypothetical protein LTS12_006682 [Elasticomyces elasticus]
MDDVTRTTIVEEPAAIALDTLPQKTVSKDVEAQKADLRARPPGMRRTSTTPSSNGSKAWGERRDTATTFPSGCTSPTLEREPTLRVEDEALHGYPTLASFLGAHQGYAIYRRFASLNARNLLYHQAKLVHLEHELHEMEQTFANEKHLHYNVRHIFGAEAGSSGYILQKKHEEVGRALDKYNSLLLEQHKLLRLPKPDSSFVESIYNFIGSEKGDKPDWLEHPENTIYAVWDDDRKPIQQDLVTLNQEFRNQDPFTRFFTTILMDWWHRVYSRFKPADGELGEYIYSEKAISKWMGVVTMIVASALPTLSIVVLYFIKSEVWRLVFIVLFSGVFAAALAIFTEARRVEVFAASVALASVQVVYVGTGFGNGNGYCNG